MKETIAFYNNEYLPLSQVSIPYQDLAFQRGHGIFDYIRTYQQKPFQKDWHAKKIINSLRGLHIKSNLTEELFLEILEKLFDENKSILEEGQEYGVKTIVSNDARGHVNIFMYIESFDADFYREKQTEGAALLLSHNKRVLPEYKSLDYRFLYMAQDELKEKDCLELLYSDDGLVYEASTSNIFAVIDGVLLTPKDGIYTGSTRDLVLAIAKELEIPFAEKEIPFTDFINAQEVFITASKKEILPITKVIDGEKSYSFPLGGLTQKLAEAFDEKKQNL